MTQFTLNGTPVEVGEHPHLLAALREELHVTSPKDGCSPSGQCGCCTVLIDGKASVSCQISLEKVAGKSITTLEGFEVGERERFAEAFAAAGALQCGFCTPGILVRSRHSSTRRALASPATRPPATSERICAGVPATARSSTRWRCWQVVKDLRPSP